MSGFLWAHGAMLAWGVTLVLGCGALAVGVLGWVMPAARSVVVRQRVCELSVVAGVVWLVVASVPMPRVGWGVERPGERVVVAERPAVAVVKGVEIPAELIARPAVVEEEQTNGVERVERSDAVVAHVETRAVAAQRTPIDWRVWLARLFVGGAGVCVGWLVLGRVVLWWIVRGSRAAPVEVVLLCLNLSERRADLGGFGGQECPHSPTHGRQECLPHQGFQQSKVMRVLEGMLGGWGEGRRSVRAMLRRLDFVKGEATGGGGCTKRERSVVLPRVWVAPGLSRPVTFGVWRPVILVPESLLGAECGGQLRQVLLHEVGHIRQGDGWGNLLFCVALPVLYWHPLYWWLRRSSSLLRELVADDWAARGDGKEAYVTELVALARTRMAGWTGAVGAMGILQNRSDFYRRMRMLLQRQTALATGCSSGCRAMLAAVTLAVVVGMGAMVGVTPARGQTAGDTKAADQKTAGSTATVKTTEEAKTPAKAGTVEEPVYTRTISPNNVLSITWGKGDKAHTITARVNEKGIVNVPPDREHQRGGHAGGGV